MSKLVTFLSQETHQIITRIKTLCASEASRLDFSSQTRKDSLIVRMYKKRILFLTVHAGGFLAVDYQPEPRPSHDVGHRKVLSTNLPLNNNANISAR